MLNKVIVTGANGFLGKYLCKKLVESGVKVIAVGRKKCPSEFDNIENLKYFSLDADDISYLNLFNDVTSNVDVFIHLAWGGTSGDGRKDIKLQNRNIEMTMKCFEFAKKIKCKKFIFAGSIQEEEIDYAKEHTELINPSLIYGSAKKYAHYLCEFSPKDEMEVCILKITNIFGPGENTPRFINTTIRKILKNESLSFSASTQNYDFIYIDDAINAIISVADKGKNEKEYVIGSGGAKPLKEFIFDILRALNSNAEPFFSSIEGLSLDKHFYDISSLIEDTGWQPTISFTEGIQLTVNWIKNNL